MKTYLFNFFSFEKQQLQVNCAIWDHNLTILQMPFVIGETRDENNEFFFAMAENTNEIKS